RLGVHTRVDVLQVGRLAAETGPVVDDLAVDLAGGVVDHRHGSMSPPRLGGSRSQWISRGCTLRAPGTTGQRPHADGRARLAALNSARAARRARLSGSGRLASELHLELAYLGGHPVHDRARPLA